MKLEKYLADYLWQEIEIIEETRHYDIPDYENLIRQGIEAFESTEGVKVITVNLGV